MKKLVILAATMLLIFASQSFAQGGFYLGAGIGNTFFSTEIDDITEEAQKIDENSTAWKIFGGFPINEFLHIEGGYRNFGDISTTIQGVEIDGIPMSIDIGTQVTGWDVEAMGRLQIAIIDVFAKAGVMFWTSELTVMGQTIPEADESGTDFLWGLGAGARLGPIGVRLEYESVAIEDLDNLGMVSLSATFGF